MTVFNQLFFFGRYNDKLMADIDHNFVNFDMGILLSKMTSMHGYNTNKEWF